MALKQTVAIALAGLRAELGPIDAKDGVYIANIGVVRQAAQLG